VAHDIDHLAKQFGNEFSVGRVHELRAKLEQLDSQRSPDADLEAIQAQQE
jgi:hypothetical protein